MEMTHDMETTGQAYARRLYQPGRNPRKAGRTIRTYHLSPAFRTAFLTEWEQLRSGE